MDRYISLKQILDDILDHPLLQKVSLERAINYTVHFLQLVGSPVIFEEKTALIPIKDYRGVLPCNLNQIIQVRNNDKGHARMHDVFRYSSDTFHMSEDKPQSMELTYKVQNRVIFTSIKEGCIEVAYNAIMTDDDGYPLIPENSSFINALELYIKKQVFTVLFDTNKLQANVYENVCQQYAWAVGQAQSSLIRPSLDQMQTIANSLNALVLRMTEHSRGFINNGSMERIKVH